MKKEHVVFLFDSFLRIFFSVIFVYLLSRCGLAYPNSDEP